MAPMVAYSLPTMQLVCNLVMPKVPGSNGTDTMQDLRPNQTRNEEDFVVEAITMRPGQLLETSTSKTDSGKLPDGYVAYPEIEVAYKIHNERVPWLVARKRCIEEGGGLAVIDSWQKYGILKSHPQFKGLPQVGIVRLDGQWVNVNTGFPVPFIPWAIDQPSGRGDCVVYTYYGLTRWSCTDEYYFACERPLP